MKNRLIVFGDEEELENIKNKVTTAEYNQDKSRLFIEWGGKGASRWSQYETIDAETFLAILGMARESVKMFDYYICFLKTEHGKKYWRIVGDLDEFRGDIGYCPLQYSFKVEAQDPYHAEEVFEEGTGMLLDTYLTMTDEECAEFTRELEDLDHF